jgi:hypothetical protein
LLILVNDEGVFGGVNDWRQSHPNIVVACYNYPVHKIVHLEINFKIPRKKEKSSTWQKKTSSNKAREWGIHITPIAPEEKFGMKRRNDNLIATRRARKGGTTTK